MIKKPVIVITSLGRTGTKFFAALFDELLPDATSLHEPDYLNFGQYRGVSEKASQVVRQLQEVGVSNLIIRKALGKWSLKQLSDRRVRRQISYKDAVQNVLSQRKQFINSRNGSIYIESSSAYYGLIDVLTDTYQRHKVAYVVRDGRRWVRSMINFQPGYDRGRIRRLISPPFPSASEIENDPFKSQWSSMSLFQQLCWAWSTLNEYAIETVSDNPNARLFQFEEIFQANDRYQHLLELVHFLIPDSHRHLVSSETLDGWLNRKIHKSQGGFPVWDQWSIDHRQQFLEICGPLMEKLGYEFN